MKAKKKRQKTTALKNINSSEVLKTEQYAKTSLNLNSCEN